MLAGCLVGGLVLSAGVTARAEPASAKVAAPPPISKADLAVAKKHYADGTKKLKAEDFSGAFSDFKGANDIKATPEAEYNLGLCEDKLGHVQGAADWYEKFLAHVPEKMADKSSEIGKRLAEIKALPGKIHVESSPPGATVTIDDKPESAPTPLDVTLSPGAHALKLTETGRLAVERSIDVAFASNQTVSVELEAEPPPPPPPPPPPVSVAPPPPAAPPPPVVATRSQLPAFITGGLAVAAAGVGTVFGAMALHDKSQFDKNPTTATADDGDTHSLISDMAFGVAVTFGVTSAVLFLTKDETGGSASNARSSVASSSSDSSKAKSVTFTPVPMVGSHSGGAGVVVRF